MGANPYVHIPKESWPGWTWYAIEFGIVIAVSMLVSREITNSIEGTNTRITKLCVYGNCR